VAGFTLVRKLGEGPRGVVYEATQPELGRRVALKLFRSGVDVPASAKGWPRHPHVCPLYTAGDTFTATRFVDGPSLAQIGDRRRACDQVAEALSAAHAAGVVHGAVSARNVLIDPERGALLTDFTGQGTPAGDLAALEALRQASPLRRPVVGVVAVLLEVVAIGGVAAVLLHADDDVTVPPAPAGAVSLGSALGGPVRSLDCNGDPADGSSPACTVMQTGLAGRRLVVERDGAVRAWAVRGARGNIALRVISRRPAGYAVTASGPWRHVASAGVQRFAEDLPVRRGDRVGLELAPGASLGVGPAPGTVARFISQLTADARPAETSTPPALAHELLLRVDVVRAAPEPAAPAATPTAAGHTLETAEFAPGGRPRSLAVVRASGGIYLDLLADGRRLARIAVAGADPHGEIFRLDPFSFATILVSWRNPDGQIIDRRFAVTPRSLRAAS
jgi:hypothetical protein